jgi:primosomal protein N' (replication factor Y)
MNLPGQLLRVAVPVPLSDEFDYLWEGPGPRPAPGARVRVPFGRGQRIGIVTAHPAGSALAAEKLKAALDAVDAEPIIGNELLATLAWAAQYYHHPIGEVMSQAMPGLLRRGRDAAEAATRILRLTPAGRAEDPAKRRARAPRQAAALELLAGGSLAETELRRAGVTADVQRRLEASALIESREATPLETAAAAAGPQEPWPELTPDQGRAVDAVLSAKAGFEIFLLLGVTGSGKTEVFLHLIRRELERGRQTLLLVPEIGLTPQLVGRLRRRFGSALAVLHSGLTDRERLDAWRKTRSGEAQLIVGTRSAVFAPLARPGLIVIDEEHDPSFKQQQGFRYSARDLAIVRARALGVPVLLASATPSLESYRNAREGRYRLLELPRRIGEGGNPVMRLVDLNHHAERQGLSTPLLAAMEQHLGRGAQVLLFINRRGFAPVLFCAECGSTEDCARCDARMTIHARAGELRCHHCGSQRELRWSCPDCGAERVAVGAGTQRVTDELAMLFPSERIARLDRDAVGSAAALGAVLEDIERGDARIIVGTQMLTKGHDFPGVTLVGVLNADQGLFGTDFRSEERLAQTIIQVAGRAGRRERAGEVVIQTHYPQHPLLQSLMTQDYAAFAELALAERRQTGWPPYSHIALWRAEAASRDVVFRFLNRLRGALGRPPANARVLGPTPDWMERRGGRFRAQLLLQSDERAPLHALIGAGLAALSDWPEARRVRWSIDVDPVEL